MLTAFSGSPFSQPNLGGPSNTGVAGAGGMSLYADSSFNTSSPYKHYGTSSRGHKRRAVELGNRHLTNTQHGSEGGGGAGGASRTGVNSFLSSALNGGGAGLPRVGDARIGFGPRRDEGGEKEGGSGHPPSRFPSSHRGMRGGVFSSNVFSGRTSAAVQPHQQQDSTGNNLTVATRDGGGPTHLWNASSGAAGVGTGSPLAGGNSSAGSIGSSSGHSSAADRPSPSRYGRVRERDHRTDSRNGFIPRSRIQAQAVSTNRLPSIGVGGGAGNAGHHHKSILSYGGSSGRELVVVTDLTQNKRSGAFSIQGLKPGNPRWENQDNFVLEEALGGIIGGTSAQDNVRFFAVMDGHGELGHLVTRRCREHLPRLMISLGMNCVRACVQMHEDLTTGGQINCSCSGATCVVTTISEGRICVANLGDSRCVLARQTGGAGGPVCAVALTNDHKPDRPDERARILAMGGQVGSRQLFVGNGPLRIPIGPARVWYQVRGETMGLAMSRSLGDQIAHSVGVSAEPEVTEHTLEPGDLFLIMASDGIWDVMDINHAVQIVMSCITRAGGGGDWDPLEAAGMLSHTARKRWESMSPMVDDITALVIKL